MTELDQKIEKATVEKAMRYPLVGIKDNLAEIREIGQMAQDYFTELDPEVLRPSRWEIIPQITIDFLDSVFKYLGDKKRTDVAEIYLRLGDIMTPAIEYATTKGADKDGTLNPKITIGPDMAFDKTDYDDSITMEQAQILEADGCNHLPIQFFEDREVIKEICLELKPKLYSRYGIKLMQNWALIPLAFVAFFRCAKKWLINHKDDGECGVEINIGDYVFMGIQKEGDDDDVEYIMYITPGQKFKLDYAKGDEKTESIGD